MYPFRKFWVMAVKSSYESLRKILKWVLVCNSGRTYFCTLSFDNLLCLCKLTQEKVIYLFWIVAAESNCEIKSISVMGVSSWALVEVVLFQLGGCGHPQDDAKQIFFLGSKHSILGLLNDTSFVKMIHHLFQKFFGTTVKT